MGAETLYDASPEPKMTRESLRMALQSESGINKVWVVVEGRGDVEVFDRMFSDSTLNIRQGVNDSGNGGYAIVEDIVAYVSSVNPEANVIGIRDKDYTAFETPPKVFHKNVFVTDRRDLEMMLSESESVRSSLMSIKDFEQAESKVMPALRYMGYQRIYVGCNHMKCDFENVVKPSLIWNYNNHDLIQNWKSNCSDALFMTLGISSSQMTCFIDEKKLELEDDYNVCRGHDYVGYISRALINTAKYSEAYLYGIIYDRYSKQDFLKTTLCASIRAWQEKRGVVVV